MKKTRMRLWSLLLTVAMVLTLLPATALAEETPGEETLTPEEQEFSTDLHVKQEPGLNSLTEETPTTETAEEVFLAAIAQGGTVTLTDNLTLAKGLTISKDKDVVLDLGGNTLTLSGTVTVQDNETGSMAGIANEGTLTIKNGTVTSSAEMCLIINSGELTLEDDVDLTKSGKGNAIDNLGGTVVSDADITLSDTSDTNYTAIVTYGGRVTINGGEIEADTGVSVFNRWYDNASAGAEVFVNGGSIQSKIYALSTNNIRSGGSKPSNVTIKGGNLTSTGATTVYWPSAGTLEIGSVGGNDNAVQITAENGSAIEVCSGTLIVNSGTLRGSDSSDALNASNSWAGAYRKQSGCAGLGDAVTIIARRGAGYDTAPLNVAINGGNFTSSDNYAVRYFDCNEVSGADQITQDVSVSISGGTFNFTGTTGGSAVDAEIVSESDQAFITGGSFSSEVPGEYMPAGYACVKEGDMYVVDVAPNGAMVVKPETDGSGEVSATLDGIYKGENTTIKDNISGSGEPGAGGSTTGTGVTAEGVTVDLTTDDASVNAPAFLTVTKTAAESLTSAPSLTVQTDVGSVKLDSEALDKMGDAKGDVVISITKETPSVADVAAAYTVEVKSGSDNLLPESADDNGEITITIPCPHEISSQENLFVYYIKNSIPYQRMEDAELTDDGENITFTTTHLSQYAVYSTEPATDYEATVTDAAGISTPHTTLSAAINAAENGDTVTLQKEVNLTNTLIINTSHSFALDLNDETLSGRVNLLQGNLTIKNGTVKHEGGQALNVYGSEIDQANYSVLKIEEDVTIEAAHGICIFPEYEGSTHKFYGYGIIVDVEGKINQGGIFVSGNLGNSSESSDKLSQSNNVPVVNVRSGAVVNNTSPNQGIAMNGYAVVNVYEGANIKGNEAIGVKRGRLNIYGGTFQAIGEKVDLVEANNNGTEETGATISVTSTYNYAGEIEIKITGGTFTSTNSAAFYVGHSQASGQPTSYQKGLSIDLKGGTFISPNGQTAVYVADAIEDDKEGYTKEIVSGGSFSSSVSEYVIDSLNAELKKSTGATPYSYYTNVEEALEHASAGDVVIDLSDPAGEASEPITAATVTYDDGGHGTAPARHNVTVGEKITLRDMEDADGYAFMGWSMGGNTYQPGDTFTVTAARTTFTAVWELKATPIEPVTDVGYLVEHYLEGRWGYELVETEFFMDKIGTTVTAQAKDYPGYRCNWLSSTFSGTLVKPESDSDVVILKLYYDKWSPSPTDDSDDDRYQLPTWDITVEDIANGDVAVSPEEAKPTTTITITVTPDKGYAVAEVVVTAENGKEITVTDKGNGKYTFSMPNSDVTIEVTFQPVSGGAAGSDLTIIAPTGWVNPFTDVAANAWYYDAVGYANANGLMGGTSATTFAPNGAMNRSMVWTVIARLAGQTISGANWAEDAKAWAVAQGVSDGTNPDGNVTREELVTMLYRYIGSPVMNVPELGLINSYPDAASVSDWAQDAFAWALSRGIIDGRDGKLASGESVTRAEAATILARFHLLTK